MTNRTKTVAAWTMLADEIGCFGYRDLDSQDIGYLEDALDLIEAECRGLADDVLVTIRFPAAQFAVLARGRWL